MSVEKSLAVVGYLTIYQAEQRTMTICCGAGVLVTYVVVREHRD